MHKIVARVAFYSRYSMFLFIGLSVIPSAFAEPIYGGEFRIPLSAEPISLDPALFSDIYAVQVANNLYDGLVQLDENLNIIPAIAKRWKISRDHRTYTFFLDTGITFHNGREVTADDFIFSFTRILDPALKSPAASYFLSIKGAAAFQAGQSDTVSGLRAPTPNQLEIQLEQPFAPFLSILAMINAKVVPQEAISPDFDKQPVGTGPFRFSSWDPGQSIIIEANPDYFAGRPYVDRVNFRVYSNIDWEQIYADFHAGELDQTFIPREQYDRIIGDTKTNIELPYTVLNKLGLNLVYIGMNRAVKPFDDVRVRRAINYAVDTLAIVNDIAKRGTKPTKGLLPPGIAGYDPNLTGYDYNPQRARELLASAGFPEGQGFPPFELWTVSKSASVFRELEAYQDYLAAIGLEVSINIADNWQGFVEAINEQRAALFYAAWYADYPDPDNFLYPLTHSKSKTNRMRFADEQVDRLLDQARVETDYLKRSQLYNIIEQKVLTGAPMVPQHINSNSYLIRPWVKGVALSQLGMMYFPLRLLWLEPQS